MESFAELLEQSEVEKRMKPGSIIMGQVVAVESEFVVVHAGLKSESIIPLDQFKVSKNLARLYRNGNFHFRVIFLGP